MKPARRNRPRDESSEQPSQTHENWRQNIALRLLANRAPKEPLAEIARQAHVSPETLTRWLGEADFQRAIAERCRDAIRGYLPLIKDVLLKKALEDGDKECLKMIVSICALLETERPLDKPKSETASLSDQQLLDRIRWFRQLYQ